MARVLLLLCALAFWSGCGGPSGTRPKSVLPLPSASAPQRPAAPASQPNPTAQAWEREAAKWLGVPYRTGGATRSGMDCSGLTTTMYLNVAGWKLPRTSGEQARTGTPVATGQLRPGDLVLFETRQGAGVNHVGVFLGQGRFVHASTSRGVIYSTLTEGYYAKAYRGGRRVLR